MERNYDEIIAEMLRQIDQHSEELTKQSEKLTKQSEELTKQSGRSDLLWREQRLINQRHLATLEALNERINIGQKKATAVLERLIRKNSLKT